MNRLLITVALVALLLMPNVAPQGDYNYTPRVGKTLMYHGYLTVIGTNGTMTLNFTGIIDFNATILTYVEVYDNAQYTVNISVKMDKYFNGVYIGSENESHTVTDSNTAYVGVMIDDFMPIYLAINTSRIPAALYGYTYLLSPMNFTARLTTYNGENALSLHILVDDEDINDGTIDAVVLVNYGIVAVRDVIAHGTNEIESKFLKDEGDTEIQTIHFHYELVDHDDMTPLPVSDDYPTERNGMSAKRTYTNGTQSGDLKITVNKVLIVGDIYLFDVDIMLSGIEPVALVRTSTFGRVPTEDDPRVLPPLIVHPGYLEDYADEYNATIDNYTVSDQTFEVYVLHVDNVTVSVIKDLGIIAYMETNDTTMRLVELNVPTETSGEESGGETGTSEEGGIGGLSTDQLVVVALAIIVLVLALLVMFLRKGA